MKKNIQQIKNFIIAAQMHINRDQHETKFKIALKTALKSAGKAEAKWADDFNDISLEHCATDANGCILRGKDNELLFTKDGERARRKAAEELTKKLYEIQPCMAKEVPKITELERDHFAGFVLQEKKKQSQ